jgi:hypothetical protein
MSKKKITPDQWMRNTLNDEAKRLKRLFAQLDRKLSMPRYRIEHAAQAMALSMGSKRISGMNAAELFQWSIKRYDEEGRKYKNGSWPKEPLYRSQLFHFARDIVTKNLEILERRLNDDKTQKS